MIVRKATQKDKKQFIKLMDMFNDYYHDENIFSEEFKPFWEYKDKEKTFPETAEEWLSNKTYFVFVAEENHLLVGYIVGHVKERKPRVLDREGYIDDWFVDTPWRSKGIGSLLYDHLIKKFKEQNCNRLGLLTNIHNTKTINFYHALGFIDESLSMVKKL